MRNATSPPRSFDLSGVETRRLPEKLRRFFLSRGVRPKDEARDLAQETILRVLQRLSRGERLDSVEAFSLGVAKNVFSEHCRRVARSPTRDIPSGSEELAGAEDPLTDALASSQAILFRKALELLPERMKSLLVKRFIEGVPRDTIAREERVSTAAIDVRVCRAKREFRKRSLKYTRLTR